MCLVTEPLGLWTSAGPMMPPVPATGSQSCPGKTKLNRTLGIVLAPWSHDGDPDPVCSEGADTPEQTAALLSPMSIDSANSINTMLNMMEHHSGGCEGFPRLFGKIWKESEESGGRRG